VLVRNVRVFDPASGTLSAASQVEVFGDKIVSVTPQDAGPAPKGETVIDGQGGTLVPGLHDMHHHLSQRSALYLLAAGVTGIRDMGSSNDAMLAMNRLIDDGKLAGPRIVRNGFLEGRSPYSARGNGFIADTLPQALEDIRWFADHGYWQVKFYNSFPPDWVAPAAAEAHRLGMGVTGHVPAFTTPDRVLKEGYDDIAHINQLMLGWILEPGEDTRTPLRLTGMARGATLDLSSPRVQATVKLMKDKGAKLDTTTVILERLMLSRAGTVQAGDVAYLSHMPIGYQRNRKRTFAVLDKPGDDAAYKAGFQKVLEVMKMLDDNGVEMLPGTDDATGFTLLRELELYVKAGIPAAKTLRLATLDDEKYFKHDQQLGTIARGKLADFILVDGDPTQDISKIRNVRMTMKGGVAYYPGEIYRYLDIEPFSPPPSVTAPAPAPAARP
jgi:imidazolonepropionase-like amidohydrolase